MSHTNTSQINLIEALPAIYTVNQPTQREIDNLVSWVKREGKLDCYTVSMVLESAVINAATKSGLLVETNNYLSLPVVEVAAAPVAQPSVEESTALCVKTDIDQQIADLKATGDSAYIQAANLYQDCLQGDWLDRLVVEIEAEQQQPDGQEDTNLDTLELPGMKCKNLDRDDDYWFFVGERFSAFAAVAWLAELGIYTSAKPNGQTGCYKVLVPRWVRGSLLPAVQSQAA